jgi:SAM-dependent methyltransferase
LACRHRDFDDSETRGLRRRDMSNNDPQSRSLTRRPESLAPEMDPSFYRSRHADLASFDDSALLRHFERHGRGEGRCASPAAHRVGFIAQIPIAGPVLEIGCGVRPALRGDRIRYFEILNRAGLIERALRAGDSGGGCPDIHYVSPTGDLAIVAEQFDAAFSSHCIEHVPDLVAHLQGVTSLLRLGGRYFLLVPDKRYCFDALLPPSTMDEVLQAYAERRHVHTESKIREHYTGTTHNDPVRHWRGDSLDPTLADRHEERAATARRVYETANSGYVDIHAWQFTPDSFRAIVGGLFARDLIRLQVERVYDTVHGENEFGAVLRAVPSFGLPSAS